MKFKNALVELAKRPRDIPMAVLGFLVLGIHKIFFSWWLDKRLVRRHDRLLAEEIREDLEFLFNEFGAQVVPNEKENPALF